VIVLPLRLPAPAPTWERTVDVVVLGSGAAGLSAALAARPVRDVLVVTKDVLSAGSTRWAQGGLAGVLDPTDSIEDHIRDTLVAGAGLCDEAAVRQLVTEAPTSIRYLMRLGAAFDPERGGTEIALTREGGHSHNRIVHAGGDRSGAEVQRTLDESALGAGVEVMSRAFALDLVVADDAVGAHRQVTGVRIGRLDEHGAVASVGVVHARAVVIASGGFGQVFASTSNPPEVTGDGVAMALRAGLAVTDLEFVQFHPTVLWRGPDAVGQQALISEAVRGEGAILYDAAGRRVMAGVHPLEDLAPRDVVAAAISVRMAEGAGGVDDHVFLDATHLGERFHERFPSITAACREIGLDPAVDRIPVAPAEHYACGGIRAGLDGRTALAGLYAVGEVASTGVHGANRLASNSLTESVVAGTRVGRDLAWELPPPLARERTAAPDGAHRPSGATGDGLLAVARLREVRASMSRHVGVLRSASSLSAATAALRTIASSIGTGDPVEASRRTWEGTNQLTVAAAVVAAALTRTESRGCHRRTDFPEPRDVWLRHLDVALDPLGNVVVTGAPSTDAASVGDDPPGAPPGVTTSAPGRTA
jgi:L-aspartate oxidase